MIKDREVRQYIRNLDIKPQILRAAQNAQSYQSPWCVIGNEDFKAVKPFDGLVLDGDFRLLFYVASIPNWKFINYVTS